MTSSTRQVAGASEFKKIPSILDNILVYAKKPIDRTVDISINTQIEETYESLDNTNGLIGLSTKHVEDHNKLLKDMLEVIKDDDSNSGGSNGGGSILDGLFGDRKPKPKKPKKDTTSKKRTAPPPASKRSSVPAVPRRPPATGSVPTVPRPASPPPAVVKPPPATGSVPTVPRPPAVATAPPPAVVVVKPNLVSGAGRAAVVGAGVTGVAAALTNVGTGQSAGQGVATTVAATGGFTAATVVADNIIQKAVYTTAASKLKMIWLRNIPVIGTGLGLAVAASRALNGDWVGAGLETTSAALNVAVSLGSASAATGVGVAVAGSAAAANIATQTALIAKDIYDAVYEASYGVAPYNDNDPDAEKRKKELREKISKYIQQYLSESEQEEVKRREEAHKTVTELAKYSEDADLIILKDIKGTNLKASKDKKVTRITQEEAKKLFDFKPVSKNPKEEWEEFVLILKNSGAVRLAKKNEPAEKVEIEKASSSKDEILKNITTPSPDATKVETPPAAASAQSQQTKPAESIDRNKLIDRLKTVSSKIQNKDESTLNRLENITMMIQNNQLNEASAAIDRMEKSLSSTQEKPLSDAFKDRQNTPPPTPGQRRSSLPDGSYQVASAQTTMTDATYITDEPEVKLASDVDTAGKNIVDPTGKSKLVISETVNNINDGQIQKATTSVDKLKTEIKEQNRAYETLNDVIYYFGIKKKVVDQTKVDTDTEDKPDTTPQVQATQNIQQPQSKVAQAPVSSGFSSGFSKMAGLAASFMGATAVGRPSGGGANRVSAGAIGSMGGGGVTGSMIQSQLSGGSATSTSGTASVVSGPAATSSAPSGLDQSKGGEQPSGNFMTEVGKVASNLGIDASNLIAIMKSESSLNPQAINPSTGASGLIQFMPNTAKSLGTTVEEIRKMTAVQQLPYVEKYFKSVRVQPGSSAGRLYAYVFLPARANREVLTQAGENYYESNKGLDIDRDGKITIADLDARLAKYGGSTSASLQGAKPATGSSLSAAGTSMEASDQAQMRSPGQALGTTASSPSTGPQGMQMPAGAMAMGEIPINIRLRQLQS